MSSRCSRYAAGLLALLLASATPASAVLVILAEGSVLKVESYQLSGDLVKLGLPEGRGFITLPLSRVERIVDDELLPPGALTRPLPRATRASILSFTETAPIPRAPYGRMIFDTARRFRLNPALMAAMARAESAFDARAVSHKGARGLMQVMPATGKRFGVEAEDLFLPERNLEAAARYLDWLRRRFRDDPVRVLAAYNAGEGTVDRYQGVPPYRETREYIRRVYAGLDTFSAAETSAR